MHALLTSVIIDVFLPLYLPKNTGKSNYSAIQYTFCLLAAIAALLEKPLRGVQNDQLGLLLKATQYALVSLVPLI